ncbi:hypothetical protein CASFOL_036419 [Castilleja foliolosa]|uniref:N-acetyltransferase domain-containing protein n=1 Tax=Castilleja foliolosa TaxID=1961234 RepID=A0ABD3BW54_9LAMI
MGFEGFNWLEKGLKVSVRDERFVSFERKRLSAVFASQEPFGTHKYAYIANVCVAKYARRQGIASNMLYLATDVALTSDNKPAQDLYNKTGFKVIEAALSHMSRDQRMILMAIEFTSFSRRTDKLYYILLEDVSGHQELKLRWIVKYYQDNLLR